MTDDRYTEHPALKPTVLAPAQKPVPRQAQPASQSDAAEDHGARVTPRAA